MVEAFNISIQHDTKIHVDSQDIREWLKQSLKDKDIEVIGYSSKESCIFSYGTIVNGYMEIQASFSVSAEFIKDNLVQEDGALKVVNIAKKSL
ncbi:hypothetical protein [Pelosinus sp. IPA-1]|uniref:hypothetical protein n=1 Tax=Pelosinus sp. IPA-1 TaxID=3029569 RepID=UPI00243625CA|nr:hypothetical protein [Pelosinus sp. IPA-1]GMB00456.1 hypothetical protein PIPA1_32550 [Pelosinus sp. IPA-1]